MSTKLIRLDDDILIEVEAEQTEYYPISSLAERIERSFEDSIRPALVKVCHHVMASWRQLDPALGFQQAEIEFGLSFEAEGNLFISKATTGANLQVRFLLIPGAQAGADYP
jgi:hypothetical protein